MDTKQSRLELKVDAQGTFTGLLSPYGPPADDGNDIIVAGAYRENIRQKGNVRPLLFSHESTRPIGTVELDDREDGLWVKGELLLDLPDAKTAYRLIQAGIMKGLSIGFRAIKKDFTNGVRHLKEIALYEASVVLFPMNDAALITSVKSLDYNRIQTELKSFREDILRELKGHYQ
jgi:HK97 family phage prohead protease